MDEAFLRQHGGKIYNLLVAMCICVVAIFTYMTYYVYSNAADSLVFITYILAIPLFVSLVLLIILLLFGREESLRQLLSE
jgi:hypothetical protein